MVFKTPFSTPNIAHTYLRQPLYRTSLKSFLSPQRRYAASDPDRIKAIALVFADYGHPHEVLSLRKHFVLPAQPNCMNLRFLASPINPADINQIQGVYPSEPAFRMSYGTRAPVACAGNEGVAEIIDVGETVQQKGFNVGDWVIMKGPGYGTWRTHASATVDDVIRLDESMRKGITPIQAATVSINPCTAYRMLRDFTTLQEGEWFIQNGANSGVGRAAIQLGAKWGYKSINIIRAREDKDSESALKKELSDLGANVVITDAELQSQSIKEMASDWTNDNRDPIRLALNCVNGKPATAMAKLLSPSAHFVTYGAMSKQPLTLPASMLIFKDIHFHGFWVSRWAERNPEDKLDTVRDILDMMRNGEFKDVPVEEVRWEMTTKGGELVNKVEDTLEGYREGKGIFVFKGT